MKTLSAALAVATLFAVAAPTVAGTPGRPSGFAVMRVCKPDMKTFCPHMGMGSSAQKRCMKENYDKLSQPCREIIDRYEGKTSQ